jgi:serine/threonine protein kinase
LHGLKGTARYIAPELVIAANGTVVADGTPQAIDMWGVGVVLHDLGHLGLTPGPAAGDDSSAADGNGESKVDDSAEDDATRNSHVKYSRLPAVHVLMQRLISGFDVQVGAHVPPGLAAVTLACLSVSPVARPTATAARQELMRVAV